MPRAMSVIWSVAALLLGACRGGGEFTCADDQACAGVGPEARCEGNGWCSFADEACGSGHRYGDHAGDGLGGVCVGEELETGTSTSSPSPTTQAATSDGPLDTSVGPGPAAGATFGVFTSVPTTKLSWKM